MDRMKLRCAILDDYQGVALAMADWSSLGPDVDVAVFRERFADEDAAAASLHDFDIVVLMRERTPFRASLFARLPKLKLLVTSGPRNASVDVAAAAARGVVFSGTTASPAPTAELTWALILGVARSIARENASLRANGPWQSTFGADLQGKRLGVLGLGRIGSHVARVGVAFGMDVVAWSQNLKPERAAEVGVRLARSKDELLETSDFVTIHLVLGDRTRGLLGAAELDRMRPSAYLINTSRAPIVDAAALLDALRRGRIAGAALDVFEEEPLAPGDPLRSLPNVLATPHLGYVSETNYRIFYGEAVEDIRAFLAGAPVRRILP